MVVFDSATGHVDSLKTSSTPGTPGRAIVNALDEGGVAAAELENFTHGTTVGTNALIERTGLQGRVRDHDRLRGHPVHPAHQPQDALRPALDEDRSRSSRAGATASAWTSGSARTARRSGRSTRPRCASSAAASATSGAEAVAISLLFSYVNPEHEERVKEIVAEELPGMPISVSHEVAPIWREYERTSTTIADAYLKPLMERYVGSLDAALRDAGMTHAVDDHEVERRRDALRRGRARPIQTAQSGPAGGMLDAAVARRSGGAEPADARHGRHQRRRRHHRRRRAAAHDRVRDRVGRAGGDPADRHQVDRRRRRHDRLDRRRRLPARRSAERGRRAGTDLLRPRRHAGRRSPTPTCCSAASIPTISSAAACISTPSPTRTRWRRSASRSGSSRSISPRRSSRSRTRTWPAPSRWSRSSAATIHGASRCSRSAAPGRCTRRRSRARSASRRCSCRMYPGDFSALGMLLADLRVDKVWTQAFRSNDVDAALVTRQFDGIRERRTRSCGRRDSRASPRSTARSACATSARTTSTRSRSPAARSTTRRSRAPSGLRRDSRRALRLRDRGRGDRAGQLPRHRDRQRAPLDLVERERLGAARALDAPGVLPRPGLRRRRRSRTARRSCRASRSRARP